MRYCIFYCCKYLWRKKNCNLILSITSFLISQKTVKGLKKHAAHPTFIFPDYPPPPPGSALLRCSDPGTNIHRTSRGVGYYTITQVQIEVMEGGGDENEAKLLSPQKIIIRLKPDPKNVNSLGNSPKRPLRRLHIYRVL